MTFTLQLAPTASVAPQSVVWEKSPKMENGEIARGEDFELTSETILAGLVDPTRSAANDSDAGNPLPAPTPVSGMTVGLPSAVLLTVIAPAFSPAVVGEKEMNKAQMELGDRNVHVEGVLENSPEIVILMTLMGSDPVFRMFTSFEALVVPTA